MKIAAGGEHVGVHVQPAGYVALLTGAELLAVRKDDLPSEAPFASVQLRLKPVLLWLQLLMYMR